MYELTDDIAIVDVCLYIQSLDTLVIGDVHIGYESSLAKNGVYIPKFQFEEIISTVEDCLDTVNPTRTVVVGDLKHEFGRISDEEWRDTLSFIDTIQDRSELVLIKGNHDTLLDPIVEKRSLDVYDTYTDGDFLFCHGHEVPEELEETSYVVIGHEHPAVGLRDGPRVELYKCILQGTYDDTTVFVLPSVSSLPEGTDVTQELLQSPFIEDIDSFHAFVVGDEIYHFGTVGNI